MTHAEQILWSRLRAHLMDGYKFRRQHAIGSYIVDFVCLQARLIIEVDGDTHDESRQVLDERRTAYLAKAGFRVLRFWNHQIIDELANVMETIFTELGRGAGAGLSPSPQPSPRWGEGDTAA
jgi:very-short-patch-repair endonuclease